MNKMQMAHDMALELVKIKPSLSAWQIADRCFEYADAMQAEADKRECKERPEVLTEEWQPDWSQAPEWANWWAMDSNRFSHWFGVKPYVKNNEFVYGKISFDKLHVPAPSFNYQGNWQDSLRKRPQ